MTNPPIGTYLNTRKYTTPGRIIRYSARCRQRTVHSAFLRFARVRGKAGTASAPAAGGAEAALAFAFGLLVTSGTVALRRSTSRMWETVSSESDSQRVPSLVAPSLIVNTAASTPRRQ